MLQHQLSLHPGTGLLADFLVYDHVEQCYKPSESKVLEKENDGEYNWNSCRYVVFASWIPYESVIPYARLF